MAKTFCISDIHGCFDELMALYAKLPIDPEKDKMVFLGDYIDRGPKSSEVVQQLMDWKEKYPHWVMVQGNHEDMMLDALLYQSRHYGSYYQWFDQGGYQTAESYKPEGLSGLEAALVNPKDTIPIEHLSFLASLPRYHEDENYIYVHGGVKPRKTPEDTDPYDLIWIRDEFIDSDYDWGKKVIYGHTAWKDPATKKFEPHVQKNKIGIDTAVCYSAFNKMTCIELPTETFYFQETLPATIKAN